MKFDDYRIAPEIKRNLAVMGLKRPTDIQFRSIPPILNGEDVLAIAQTGTGKTAAFAIPIVHMLHEQKRSRRTEGIKCVVMEPTRELALQITEVFDSIGKHTKVKALCVFGGVEQDPQIARLEQGIDVLIATPGRMFDLVSQGHIHLNQVQMLVLDEADHMLDLGFIKDIQDLIRFLPRKRQTLFFSATINEKIKKLAYSLVKNPIRIQIAPDDPVARNIVHSVAFIGMDDKRIFLARLIQENPDSKILVFVRTKVRAERVSKALARAKIHSITIHGDKDQHDRLDVMKQFREGSVKILIATDVSARGIDISDVDIVVNYDLPDVAENYVHRVGRTGRGDRKGKAISFCSPEEKPVLDEIEGFLGKPVTVLAIDKKEYKETLITHSDHPDKWKALMEEIEKAEQRAKKRRKDRR
ncbi:MAG TPA: DEAD/DEAH box helicase [Syntrophales bacterium]|nr:DEAD/DEAH box helicase [Syntrophales bacterium]